MSTDLGTFCRNIILYPKGNGEFRGSNISIYLTHARFYALPDKFFLKFILRVKDQINGEDLSYQSKSLNIHIEFNFLYVLIAFLISDYFQLNICFLLRNLTGVMQHSCPWLNWRIPKWVTWWMTVSSLRQKLHYLVS